MTTFRVDDDELARSCKPLLDLIQIRYVTAEWVARRWGFTVQHFANLRRAGKGLAYIRFGRNVRYPLSEVVGFEIASRSEHVTRDQVALAVHALPGLSADAKANLAAQLDMLLFTGRLKKASKVWKP
jgi:hypothetical protein